METAEKIDTPGKSHKILNAKHKIYKISIVINTGNGNQRIDINYRPDHLMTVKEMYQNGFSNVINLSHPGGIIEKVTVSATSQKQYGWQKIGQFYFMLTYKDTDKEYPARVTRFYFYTQK